MSGPEHAQITRLRTTLAPADAVAFPDERDRFAQGKRSRFAAVAAVLRPAADGALELLLITRAQREGDVWSGHVALPGGRREPNDLSPAATAARETVEEVLIDLAAPGAELLGALPVLAPSNPRLPQITVQPFVWLAGAGVEASTSDEVAAVRWVTLDYLRHADHHIEHHLTLPDGAQHAFPAIALGEEVLWGMTHHIVHTLIEAVDPT